MSTSTNFVLVPNEPVEKINGAEMSAHAFDHRRGRNRNRSKVRTAVKLSPEEEARQEAVKEARRNAPTAERQAKGGLTQIFDDCEDGERFIHGQATRGPVTYRAPPPIERMRDRDQLDPNPQINYAMFAAAEKLEELFYDSGLSQGVKAQDISRIVVHGGDAAGRWMPQGEKQAHCRQQFRLAVKLMGYFEAHPHKGAGRLVVDVVCYGKSIRDAAAAHMLPGRTMNLQIAGMDRLREGLFALAVHWRLC